MGEILLNYGALGAMMIFMIWLVKYLISKMEEIIASQSETIKANTVALTLVTEVMRSCTKK